MEEALSGCCSRCANGLKAGTSVRRLPPATGMGTWQLDQLHYTEVVSCLGRMFSLEPVARAFQLSVPFNARREIIAPLQLIAAAALPLVNNGSTRRAEKETITIKTLKGPVGTGRAGLARPQRKSGGLPIAGDSKNEPKRFYEHKQGGAQIK